MVFFCYRFWGGVQFGRRQNIGDEDGA